MPARQDYVYPASAEPPGRRNPAGWRWVVALVVAAGADVGVTLATGNAGLGAMTAMPFITLLR